VTSKLPQASREAETFVTRHLRAAAAAMGVDPARLVFADPVGWRQHVRRGALAGLFLDTTGSRDLSLGTDLTSRGFDQSWVPLTGPCA
jgi:hypothetical protein